MGLCPSRNVEREREEESIDPVVVTPDQNVQSASPTPNAQLNSQNDQEIVTTTSPTPGHTLSPSSSTVTSTNENEPMEDYVPPLEVSPLSQGEMPSGSELESIFSPTSRVLVLVLPPTAETNNRPRLLLIVIDGADHLNGEGSNSEEENFQNLLNHLFQNTQPKNHPTSPKVLKSLPTVVIQEELLKKVPRCVICCEDFTMGQTVVKMPCDHYFEQSCVEPWLKENNTCPVCRYELPVEDEEYEQTRKEKMKRSRNNIDEEAFFDNGKSEADM